MSAALAVCALELPMQKRRVSRHLRNPSFGRAIPFALPVRHTCAWDQLLRSMVLTDEQALAILRKGGPGRMQIAVWVKLYYGDRFVPEEVLGVMGLELGEL